MDGRLVAQRSSGDVIGIANAYESGRVNEAVNMTLPVIDYRSWLDDQKNIHTRHRTFAMMERMIKTNGTRDNMAVWTIPGTTPNSNPNLIRLSVTVMNQWLEGFPYRIHIQLWMFVLVALTAFTISLLTISVNTIRAAMQNPVNSLRAE